MIYFVEAVGTNRVKIGTTRDLKQRMISLRVENPGVELRVLRAFVGGRPEEKQFHELFEPYGISGEWFLLDRVEANLPGQLPEEIPLDEVYVGGKQAVNLRLEPDMIDLIDKTALILSEKARGAPVSRANCIRVMLRLGAETIKGKAS